MTAVPFDRVPCTVCGIPKWPSAFMGGSAGRLGACRTCRNFQRTIRDKKAALTRAMQRVETVTRELADEEARFLAYQRGERPAAVVRRVEHGHGQPKTYRKGCRCAVCCEAMRAYGRERREAVAA